VESTFAPGLLAECKSIAHGGDSKRCPKKYLFIPAGDDHDLDADPPPEAELLPQMTVQYQQGKRDSCLRHSLASAFYAMGFDGEAKELADQECLSGCNIELLRSAGKVVRRVFAKSNLEWVKLFPHACNLQQVTAQDSSWPIVLIIQTSDGIYGAHAVTTWKGMIIITQWITHVRV
jgi:hypothetical protein